MLDITWLADANLAASNTFGLTRSANESPADGEVGSTGRMNWATANARIDAMNLHDGTGYRGFNDWRLPTLSPIGGGATFATGFSNNATTDRGYAKTTTDGSDGGWRDGVGTPVSEMGYMYYVNLAKLGLCTPNDAAPGLCDPQLGWGLVNTADFVNIQSNVYWSRRGAWFRQRLVLLLRPRLPGHERQGLPPARAPARARSRDA